MQKIQVHLTRKDHSPNYSQPLNHMKITQYDNETRALNISTYNGSQSGTVSLQQHAWDADFQDNVMDIMAWAFEPCI